MPITRRRGLVLLLPGLLALGGAALAQGALAGHWRGVMMTPWGQPMGTETIFFPNGTYTTHSWMGDLQTRHWGHYEVVQNWIHFRLEGAEPREHCGPQRCTPLAWPRSETWTVTRFDGEVLETPNGRMQRVR